jgi:hypothetical protein
MEASMGKWLELAEQLEAHDNSDDSANSPPIVTNVANVSGLPSSLIEGLERLRTMPAPRVRNTSAWRLAVADALALARDGWAERALSLGWGVSELFGAVAAVDGCADDDGLAAWLQGRKLSVMSGTFALVEVDGLRSYFNRHDRGGTRLLWEFGR